MQTIIHHPNEYWASIASYATAALGFLQQTPWMSLGAAVLLVARLIRDVPPAIQVIKDWRQKRKQGRLF